MKPVLNTILNQQQKTNKLFSEQAFIVNGILEKLKGFEKIIPENIGAVAEQFEWISKIADIKHTIPTNPKTIYSKLFFDERSSALLESYKWMNDFKIISKPFPLFDNIFSPGEIYKYKEWDFSETFEEYDDVESQPENILETPTSVIVTEARRVKGIISDIYLNNAKLLLANSRDFEKIIAELLFNKGFQVELTKQTRDNGYDILALKYIDNFSPIKYLVECKKYNEKNKVGVEIVRSFKEVISTEQANKGIIVTTSYFTIDAIKKQKETPFLLDYKNKDDVISWVNEYMNTK